MRTPIRKAGKYTNLKPDPNITQKKYNELKNHLDRLEEFSQPNAAKEVKRLAEMGDFSENAAYQMAKGRLRGINQKILDLKEQLKNAVIIKSVVSNGRVQIGNIVTVEARGKQKKYQILGSAETDPVRGIISHNSLIGEALIGKKLGDVAIVDLGSKMVGYEIIKIE